MAQYEQDERYGPTIITSDEPERPAGTYIVQENDTLWDLSDQVFGDALFWPTLWSYNPQITNPHWIYPGDLIYLFARGADARQVSGGDQGGLGQDSPHRCVGPLSGAAPGSVSDGDKPRLQRLQPLDRVPEGLFHLLRLGREELERHLNRPAGGFRGRDVGEQFL